MPSAEPRCAESMPTWGAQHRGRWEGRIHCVPPAPCFLKALFWRLCLPRGSGALDHAHSNRLTRGDSLSILAPWQEKKLREDNAQSQDEASRESGGECAALALLLAWDCGRDRERQCWSGLLSSGEVVMEGDQGVERREPTPRSGPRAALMLFLICHLVTTSLV